MSHEPLDPTAESLRPKWSGLSLAALLALSAPAVVVAQEKPAADAAPAPEPPKVDVTGFVDVYYGYNFNQADPGAAHLRRAAQHLLAEPGRGGLRQGRHSREPGRLPHGPRLRQDRRPRGGLRARGRTAQEIYKHIQQAYVSLLTGKVQWDVGKFVTPIGTEVIESQDNWNYTRSILFGYAIPFYHVGVRGTLAGERQGDASPAIWSTAGTTAARSTATRPSPSTPRSSRAPGSPGSELHGRQRRRRAATRGTSSTRRSP